MTAPSSIDDPAEFLNQLLGQSSPDLLRQLLEGFVNTILSAQADQVCGAPLGVRDEARVNRRNGYRHRDLDTRIGTLDVAMALDHIEQIFLGEVGRRTGPQIFRRLYDPAAKDAANDSHNTFGLRTHTGTNLPYVRPSREARA